MQPRLRFNLVIVVVTVFSARTMVKCDLIAQILNSATDWDEIEEAMAIRPQLMRPTEEYRKANLVRFYLYTNTRNQFYPEEIIFDNYQSLARSSFNPNLPVKLFIHGFGHHSNCSFPQGLKDTYIDYGYNVNIITVDWGALSSDSTQTDPVIAFKNYQSAVDNVALVGRRVGDFITFLVRHQATTLSKVHIIGFSLGAHVSGWAGLQVFRSWFDKVGRITGLDPAGPLFTTGKVGKPLTAGDAHFVDIMHTDMGQCGIVKSLGHANFFVNSGWPSQPGCLASVLQSDNFLTAIPLALSGSCSHNTAPIYFNMTIARGPYSLIGKKCLGHFLYRTGVCFFAPHSAFGEQCEPSARGDYFIDLKPTPESDYRYNC